MESCTCDKLQFFPWFIIEIYAEIIGPDFQGFTEIFGPFLTQSVKSLPV